MPPTVELRYREGVAVRQRALEEIVTFPCRDRRGPLATTCQDRGQAHQCESCTARDALAEPLPDVPMRGSR